MEVGAGRMCIIWFVVEWFRSHCSTVTAAGLAASQKFRKHRGRESDRLHRKKQTEILTGKQAGRRKGWLTDKCMQTD